MEDFSVTMGNGIEYLAFYEKGFHEDIPIQDLTQIPLPLDFTPSKVHEHEGTICDSRQILISNAAGELISKISFDLLSRFNSIPTLGFSENEHLHASLFLCCKRLHQITLVKKEAKRIENTHIFGLYTPNSASFMTVFLKHIVLDYCPGFYFEFHKQDKSKSYNIKFCGSRRCMPEINI